MSFNSDFERAFIQRSLALVQNYQGPYDASLLLNCLLGLLIVPKESCLKAIPADPVSDLVDWGVSPECIKKTGKYRNEDDNPETLRGLVWRLRNAVAHFHFRPIPAAGEVKAFHFHDQNGFEAEVKLQELNVFVDRLAKHLETL